jgi:hypothetical protein
MGGEETMVAAYDMKTLWQTVKQAFQHRQGVFKAALMPKVLMDIHTPYQAPASPPPMFPPSIHFEPAAVKVFGVIHLIFAGLGILMATWSVFSSQINQLFPQSNDPTQQLSLKYQAEFQWLSIMSGCFMLILAAMLITSGLKLVRSQPDGVKWSHRYAWTSIATKLITLVLNLIYILPVTNQMMEEIIRSTPSSPGMPSGMEATMQTIMKGSVGIGIVGGGIIALTYPVLALFFLSRPAVKEWVAARKGQPSIG